MSIIASRQNPPSQGPSSTATQWCLSGRLLPGEPLARFPITGPSFVIGRKLEASLTLSSMCVSGRHAELLQIGEHLFIRDLGSTNGTFVNRRRVNQPTPVVVGDHIEIADIEFRLELADNHVVPDLHLQLKKTAAAIDTLESEWILSQFDELIRRKAVNPFYQRIVTLESNRTMGFEALARSSLCGLENPGRMFQTARLVCREAELSIVCRQRAAELSDWIPKNMKLFLNTHPTESLDIDVLPSLGVLRNLYPWLELVVEIHEGAIEDSGRMNEFCQEARRIGAKVAYDDFGAGQSRLLELVKAPPDYLKFDASMIRDIDSSSAHQRKMLKLLVQIALDVPTIPLAEGIETMEEAEVCYNAGFQLAQGYYFGKPLSISDCVTETKMIEGVRQGLGR